VPSILSVRDLAKETRELAVPLSDDVTITVTYRPKYYTLAFEDDLIETTGLATRNAMTLCEMVVAWDLTDLDGITIPLTVEAIKETGISNDVVIRIIDAIADDARPKEKRLNGSSRS
jgi:hypothetical protein